MPVYVYPVCCGCMLAYEARASGMTVTARALFRWFQPGRQNGSLRTQSAWPTWDPMEIFERERLGASDRRQISHKSPTGWALHLAPLTPGPQISPANPYRKHFGGVIGVIQIYGNPDEEPDAGWSAGRAVRGSSIRVRREQHSHLDDGCNPEADGRLHPVSPLLKAESAIHIIPIFSAKKSASAHPPLARSIFSISEQRECAVSSPEEGLGGGTLALWEPSKHHHDANASTSSYHWRCVLPCRVMLCLFFTI